MAFVFSDLMTSADGFTAGVDQTAERPFGFVTGGIEHALSLATAAVSTKGRVSIAGGAATVNQYLAAGLIDELRTHITYRIG